MTSIFAHMSAMLDFDGEDIRSKQRNAVLLTCQVRIQMWTSDQYNYEWERVDRFWLEVSCTK